MTACRTAADVAFALQRCPGLQRYILGIYIPLRINGASCGHGYIARYVKGRPIRNAALFRRQVNIGARTDAARTCIADILQGIQCHRILRFQGRIIFDAASQRLQIHISACRDAFVIDDSRRADYGHIPRGRQCFVIFNRTAFRNQFDAAAAFHRNAFFNAASRQNAITCIDYIAFQRLQRNLMGNIIATAHNNIAAVGDVTLTQ